MQYIEIELDPTQRKAWDQTRTALLWVAPGFTHIFHTMLARGKNMLLFTNDIPTMATDGVSILANPKFFFELQLFERVFALCHEIMHAVLGHMLSMDKLKRDGEVPLQGGRTLPYVHMIANMAQDYVINDMLVVSKIGTINKAWLHDQKIGTHADNWVTVYERLFKNVKQIQIQMSGGEGKGGNDTSEGKGDDKSPGQFDDHLSPGSASGKTPEQTKQENSPQAWKNAMAAAAAITKEALGRGSESSAIVKFFEQFLEPTVSWVDQIVATFSRKVGSGSYDYRRPDRRLIMRDIYAPGRSGHGAGTIVVAMDSSGSIYAVQHLIDRFFAELAGMFSELKPRRIIVIWCDAEIKRVDYIDDEMDLLTCRYKGAPGGGGTRFEPPFKWLEKEDIDDIDALVYLTDGEGSFPSEAPKYPVIWGDIKGSKYPFGDVVRIPADGTA